MRLISIALNAGTPVQRNQITKLFSDKHWAYWHWIDDFWIVEVPDDYTVKSLYGHIEKLPDVGVTTILLFEFKGRINFWGRAKKEAWDWLDNIGSSGD